MFSGLKDENGKMLGTIFFILGCVIMGRIYICVQMYVCCMYVRRSRVNAGCLSSGDDHLIFLRQIFSLGHEAS